MRKCLVLNNRQNICKAFFKKNCIVVHSNTTCVLIEFSLDILKLNIAQSVPFALFKTTWANWTMVLLFSIYELFCASMPMPSRERERVNNLSSEEACVYIYEE